VTSTITGPTSWTHASVEVGARLHDRVVVDEHRLEVRKQLGPVRRQRCASRGAIEQFDTELALHLVHVR
jgi:hypothetical protein